MKILSSMAIKRLEVLTIDRQKITSRDLMERAARAIFQKLQQRVGECKCIFSFFCGPGNNGGDGLTLARMLNQAGHTIEVYLLEHDRYTEENSYRQKVLQDNGISILPLKLDQAPTIDPQSIIIDALFGQGLRQPLEGCWSSLIQHINNLPNPIFSIDLPSGLSGENSSNLKGASVRATHTFCISFPKLNILLPENAEFSQDFSIVDIGLDNELWETFNSGYHYTCKENILRIPKGLNKFCHKGTLGQALLVGGKHGSIGAMSLSCRAASRTGCGLVTAYIPKCGYDILQITCPEALIQTDNSNKFMHKFDFQHNNFKAIGIGMGLGTQKSQSDSLINFISSLNLDDLKPKFLFDADAINIIAKHPEIHHLLPKSSILTPHPKELKRLIGEWSNDHDMLEITRDWCIKNQQVIVIKGAHTAIVLPDGNIHFNSTGNPGMATAGSGDVLSGIITSLLAQQYKPAEAAILGVFLHGLAGDIAATYGHPKSLIASDITDHIAQAWKQIAPYHS